MKKFLSILLAAMMVLAMTAAYADFTYTVTAPNNGHTYEILQIFTGDYSSVTDPETQNTTTTLSNAKWGKNGVGETGTVVPESVLNALKALSGSSEETKRAEILKQVNLGSEVFATITPETEGLAVTVPAGYYLIRDKADTVTGDQTATLYIVEVADSITINPKSSTVQFEKKIKDVNDSEPASTDPMNPTDWQDSADYDIGDHVPFKLSFTLPADYAAYSTYYLSFNDTMESTLAFDGKDSVIVEVDGVENKNWSIETPGTNGETFQIIMDNVKEDAPAAVAGSVITVEYTATLQSTANIGVMGNMNKANATFSNNPYSDSKGTTLDDAVICFTYTFEVNKVDGEGEVLPGAEFTLEKYNAAENEWENVAVAKNEAGTVFTFKGLDDGTYRLTETVTPTGYNTCDPMTFDVVAGHTTEVKTLVSFAEDGGRKTVLTSLSGNQATGSVGDISITHDATNNVLTTTVKNYSGATLPETGGIGTTLFYLIGGLMAAGSALTLVIRRRADADEE